MLSEVSFVLDTFTKRPVTVFEKIVCCRKDFSSRMNVAAASQYTFYTKLCWLSLYRRLMHDLMTWQPREKPTSETVWFLSTEFSLAR